MRANLAFVQSQSPTRQSVLTSLKTYEPHLPQDYQLPNLCKLPQVGQDPDEHACDYRKHLFNQAVGVMLAYRYNVATELTFYLGSVTFY